MSATSSASHLRLTAPALAVNVALVRQALAGFLDAQSVSPALGADMKIAVTEACTNVVLHAYPGRQGPLEATMTLLGGNFLIGVRDQGLKFKPLVGDGGSSALGFGLAMIATLSHEFGIRSSAKGTEVQMIFSLDGQETGDALRARADTAAFESSPPAPLDGIGLSFLPGAPLSDVLRRVVSLLAVRADFSLDRLSDAQLVSDAIANHAPPRTTGGVVHIGVSESEGSFSLCVGPLEAEGGRALVGDTSLPGVGSLLARLSDELAFEPMDGAAPSAETLRLSMSRRG